MAKYTRGVAPRADGLLNSQETLNKYTIELTDEEFATLRQMAEDQGIELNLALRKAIATENFMRTKLKRRFRILTESPNRQYEEVIFR